MAWLTELFKKGPKTERKAPMGTKVHTTGRTKGKSTVKNKSTKTHTIRRKRQPKPSAQEAFPVRRRVNSAPSNFGTTPSVTTKTLPDPPSPLLVAAEGQGAHHDDDEGDFSSLSSPSAPFAAPPPSTISELGIDARGLPSNPSPTPTERSLRIREWAHLTGMDTAAQERYKALACEVTRLEDEVSEARHELRDARDAEAAWLVKFIGRAVTLWDPQAANQASATDSIASLRTYASALLALTELRAEERQDLLDDKAVLERGVARLKRENDQLRAENASLGRELQRARRRLADAAPVNRQTWSEARAFQERAEMVERELARDIEGQHDQTECGPP